MCKVLIIPKITKETRTNALKFTEMMKRAMSEFNRDGLGYAAIDSEGKLFGERWHLNEDALGNKADIPNPLEPDLEGLYTTTKENSVGKSNSFGTVNMNDITAITLHTRMATSGKEFKNTHPFVYEDADTSLIHNGVIRNTNDFEFKVSDCDSESILISYLKTGVNTGGLVQVNEMAKMLKGYYAAALFSRDAEGNRILDVFKSSASLYATFVKELDSIVFATSDTDLEKICAYLKFSKSKTYTIKDGISMRFQDGRMLTKDTFIESAQHAVVERSSYQSSFPPYRSVHNKRSLTKEEIEYYKLPTGIKAVV